MKNSRTLLTVAAMTTLALSAEAEDPIVFASAFASGETGAIHAYRFDAAKGTLTLLHRTTDVENPFFMALSPGGEFLYAIHALAFGGKENEEVAAYRVEGRSGKLELLNRQSARGTASCYLDVDATGKTVVVANYSTGDVASLPIKEDGSLGESVSYFQHEGSSVDPQRQKGPNAHSFVVSPDNRFAFAADLGIDKIMSYRLDAATATLTPNDPAFVALPPGSGPRHQTFHPNGKYLYAINELANTISVFAYDAERGALSDLQLISTVPDDFDGKSHTADLKITPDGRHLYGTNRGHDSIASYRIGDDGKLTLLGIQPSLGKGPQNLAILPDGKHLICANMPGNKLVVFAIDAESGALTPVGDPVEMPMPACLMVLP
ncbi:MAG: lactonase family protein [Verrucomicrobiae bacterium]|nr:lactonase family protein [Verrucomicrobiae bacterium]